MKNEEFCKQCGRKLLVKATKKSASQQKKPFYYTAYYFCNHCQKLYHSDKFKVVNQPTESLFLDDPIEKRREEEVNDALDVDAEIWTDGACTNNGYENAKAAWAFVSGDTEQSGLVEGKQTNNRAEAFAIFYALKWASEQGYKNLRVHSDSQISLFNLKKSPQQVKMNREIFEMIDELIKKNNLKVDFVKVLGHSGDINNERADRLANGLATEK